MVEAHWNGEWPCLCYGKWTLKVNGDDVPDKIPKNLRKSEMNTYGVYQSWHFDENYMEEFEDYEDGLDCEEWIEPNKEWLDTISTDYRIQQAIYCAIGPEDFRKRSCNGCIYKN